MSDDAPVNEDDDFRALREQANRAREADEARTRAEQEAAELRRQLAFMQAGVDLNSKAGSLLFKAYDGELTADAIRAEWEGLAPAQPAQPADSQPAPQQQVPQEVREFEQLRQTLTSGAAVPPPTDNPHPHIVANDKYMETIAKTGNLEAAAAAAVEELWRAALHGDKRIVLPSGMASNEYGAGAA